MNRQTSYTTAIPRIVDFLQIQQNSMISLAQIAEAVLGSSAVVWGFSCQPTAPASLSVALGAGQVFQKTSLEATTWSALNADTGHQIVKQGIALDAQNVALTPPSTGGFSQVFLIEVQYQDLDGSPVVLPYVNTSPPYTPLNGPGGSGTPQNTQRLGIAAVQVKAGVAATTGTQTAPAVDSGWTGLWLVTLAQGQTTITSGNIAQLAGAPFVSLGLPQVPATIQSGAPLVAHDTGTTNTLVATFSPAITNTSIQDGTKVRVKIANNNTNTTTANFGNGVFPVVQGDGATLSANVLIASQWAEFTWDAGSSQWQLTRAGESAQANSLNLGAVAPQVIATYPGALTNLHLANDGTTPNTDVDIQPGQVRDDTGAVDMVLNATLIKRISVAWVAGGATAAGGLDTTPPVGNNKTVHAFLIGKLNVAVAQRTRLSNTATLQVNSHGQGVGNTVRVFGVGGGYDGVATVASVPDANHITYANTGSNESTTAVAGGLNGFDVLFSQSLASPALPSGWTVKQCLGSVLTGGTGNIIAFTQVGNEFLLQTPVLDISNPTPGILANTGTLGSVPTGLKLKALLTGLSQSSLAMIVSSLDTVDLAPSVTVAPLINAGSTIGGAGVSGQAGQNIDIWTNTAAQIRYRVTGNSPMFIVTRGWGDPRRLLF